MEIRPYWDTRFPVEEELAGDRRSDEEVVEGFRAVLDDAVRERMVADVEVASYLSGGIDSCAVLGLAQRHTDRPIRAFTISFGDELYDEQRQAERTARWLGSRFHPVAVSQTALADAFEDAVWHAETLIINGHGIAKYLLSRAVRDAGIKVVFTGEGADEILGGYPPLRRDALLHAGPEQVPAQTAKLLAELQATTRTSPGLLSADGEPAPRLHKHPFMAPPARDSGDPLAVHCQDLLRAPVVDDQPFFDPVRVRGLMDTVATLEPDARAAHEGVVLRVASACLLQRRFAPSA